MDIGKPLRVIEVEPQLPAPAEPDLPARRPAGDEPPEPARKPAGAPG